MSSIVKQSQRVIHQLAPSRSKSKTKAAATDTALDPNAASSSKSIDLLSTDFAVGSPPRPGVLAPPPSPSTWPDARPNVLKTESKKQSSKRVHFHQHPVSHHLEHLSFPQFCAHQGWVLKDLHTNEHHALGMTKLHQASAAGNVAAIHGLIDAGSRGDTERYNFFNQTSLHLATLGNQLAAVTLLLARGANPNTPDGGGDSALALACRASHSERLILALLSAPSDLNTQNALGKTPLHHAGVTHNLNAVALLLNARAQVDIMDHAGNTPLADIAQCGGPLLAAQWLCEQGRANPNIFNFNSQSPVTLALLNRRADLLAFFVARGPIELRGSSRHIGLFRAALERVAPQLLSQVSIRLVPRPVDLSREVPSSNNRRWPAYSPR